MRSSHEIGALATPFACIGRSTTVSDFLLDKDDLGHDTLDHLNDGLDSVDVDLALEMTNHMADTFLSLTDQQLAWINQFRAFGAHCRDQTCVPEHEQNLFPFPVLTQLLLSPDLILFPNGEGSSFTMIVAVVLILFEWWAEEDQMQVVVFCEMRE